MEVRCRGKKGWGQNESQRKAEEDEGGGWGCFPSLVVCWQVELQALALSLPTSPSLSVQAELDLLPDLLLGVAGKGILWMLGEKHIPQAAGTP